MLYFLRMTEVANGRNRRSGFTIVELLVVIAVAVVLTALLMSGIQSARTAAARTQCINNLKQIGLGIFQHIDVKGSVPTAAQMESVLTPIVQSSQVFQCPVVASGRSYGYNTCADRLLQDGDSGRIVALDARCLAVPFTGSDSATWKSRIDSRHNGLMNVLLLDGHVETLGLGQINPFDPDRGSLNATTYWRPTAGCNGSLEDCTGCDEIIGGMSYYYSTLDFTGTPATRHDTTLHCPFGGGVLDGSIPYSSPTANAATSSPASFKMVGKIVPDTTDTYTFYMAVDDYGWFYLNGQLTIQWYGGTRGWSYYYASNPIQLTGGQPVDFELRQANTGWGPAHVSVLWSTSANPTPRVIPAANLR